MPAIRFFSLLASGRKIRAKEDALKAVVACDAASIALADGKYYEEMRKHYLTMAVGHEVMEESAKKRAMDPTDERTVALVSDLFAQAERLS